MDLNEKLTSSLGLSELVDLVAAAPRDVVVVTANNRLHRFLHLECSRVIQSRGGAVSAWDSPDVLTRDGWVRRLWNAWQLNADCGSDRDAVLLGSEQDEWLWLSLIKRYLSAHDDDSIMMPEQAASEASHAWRMLYDANVPPEQLQDVLDCVEAEYSDDPLLLEQRPSYVFASLVSEQRLDATGRYITLPEALHRLCAKGVLEKLQLPQTIVFAGFSDLLSTNVIVPKPPKSPYKWPTLLQSFRARVASCVHNVYEYYVPYPHDKVETLSAHRCAMSLHELSSAARWAKSLCDSSKKKPLRIGIVVPDLQNRLRDVETELTRVLYPEVYTDANFGRDYLSDRKRKFNISIGVPLSRQMAIVDALAVLRLVGGGQSHGVPFETLSTVLLSRWFAESSEGYVRRQWLERKLRLSGRSSYHAYDLGEFGCASSQLLSSIVKFANNQNNQWIGDPRGVKKLPSEWVEEFKKVLEYVGWLNLSADEYRDKSLRNLSVSLHQSFSDVLDSLALYDVFDGSVEACVSAPVAVDMLERAVRQISFQTGGGDNAPVQVMGLLEMNGQEFDHLWICGLDDKTLPASSKLNAFLPPSLQKYYNMPRSTPDLCYSEADKLMQMVCHQVKVGGSLVFSAAQKDRKGNDLRCSALVVALAGTPQVESMTNMSDGDFYEKLYAMRSKYIESVDEEVSAPLVTNINSPARGGTGLIKNYFNCPFHAYVQSRLGNPQPLEEVVEGANAMSWGTIIHRVMRHLWKEIGTLYELRKLIFEKDDLERTIERAIEDVCDDTNLLEGERPFRQYDNGKTLQRELKAGQAVKLKDLLVQWFMMAERDRDPFVIEELEMEITGAIKGSGPLELYLKCCIDRIDRTEETNKFNIVDYKTGKGLKKENIVVNSHENLSEPQLAIYYQLLKGPHKIANESAARYGSKVGSVGLGVVNHERMEYAVQRDSDLNKPYKSTKPFSQREMWDAVLKQAVDGIVMGDIRLGKGCDTCGLQSLCRVCEARSGAYGFEEDVED